MKIKGKQNAIFETTETSIHAAKQQMVAAGMHNGFCFFSD